MCVCVCSQTDVIHQYTFNYRMQPCLTLYFVYSTARCALYELLCMKPGALVDLMAELKRTEKKVRELNGLETASGRNLMQRQSLVLDAETVEVQPPRPPSHAPVMLQSSPYSFSPTAKKNKHHFGKNSRVKRKASSMGKELLVAGLVPGDAF